MQASFEAVQLMTATGKKDIRFGLRSLMLIVSLSAGWLAYISYHQPLSTDVSYRFAVVDASALELLVNGNPMSPEHADAYGWVILDDSELAEALKLGGRSAPIFGEMSRTISLWPRVAVTGTYSSLKHISLGADHHHTTSEQGTLSGFIGSRRSGSRPQLRVEGRVTYSWPTQDAAGASRPVRHTRDGELFYEGDRPQGHLLFFASIGDETYHTVIFSAK